MRALLCKVHGGPETLAVEVLPDTVPGPGEVAVDIRYAGLNFFDTLIIENKYQFKPDLPFSPGGEFSGTVRALGAGVAEFALGDRVAGFVTYGACRTQISVPANHIVKIPDDVPDEAAAGLFVTYGTTIHAFVQRACLQPGETLAVLGASGGVGLAAVEIGRLMGAHVIACASSPDKIAFAIRHGAHEGLDYSAENLKDGLKARTGGRGADVVYDPVGGDLSELALRAIAWKGRFLVIGFAAGDIPKFPLNVVMLKGCDVQGVFWGDFAQREPDSHRQNMAQLLDWAARGDLSAHIHAIYPLEQAADALGVIKRREAKGKVLLSME